MSHLDEVLTIVYRLENDDGEMPGEVKGPKLSYVNPAAFLEKWYEKFLRKENYGIYEYIVRTHKDMVHDDGRVYFEGEGVMSKERVY